MTKFKNKNYNLFLDMQKNIVKEINPEIFNDKIALKTSWKPIMKGGRGDVVYETKLDKPYHLTFVLTQIRRILGKFILFIGAILLLVCLLNAIFVFYDRSILIMAIPVSTIVFIIGARLTYFIAPVIHFDLRAGYYWRGKKQPKSLNVSKDMCELSEIYAIQIIKECYIYEEHANLFTYELNLIFRDGSRRHVADYGARGLDAFLYDQISKDAKILSEFLDLPLWDASSK